MTARRVRWCQRANGPLMARKVENYIAEAGAQTRVMPVTCTDIDRAGDGNRTRMTSLEGWGSTIELRPQQPPNSAAVTGSVPSLASVLAHPAGIHAAAPREVAAHREVA